MNVTTRVPGTLPDGDPAGRVRSSDPRSVAVVTDHMYTYQLAIIAGIQRALAARAVGATVYFGRELNTIHASDRKANDIYRLIHPDQHRAVLILSANLSFDPQGEDLHDFARGFAPLPVVSVGRVLPGIPSITIDNASGMRALMDHLLLNCGHRRLAFVRGVPSNPDSILRENIFREALTARGLTAPEEHFVTGDFLAHKAYSAVTRLLGRTRDLDAIVCANDEMTAGTVKALREHGLRVPEDVAVTGYDDYPEYRYAIPPLTTVGQPLFEQGFLAAELACRLEDGEAPQDTTLDSLLVVRQSCGSPAPATPATPPPSAEAVRGDQEHDQAEMLRRYRDVLSGAGDRQDFLVFWKDTLLLSLRNEYEFNSWRYTLEAFRDEMSGSLRGEELVSFEALHITLLGLLYDALQMAHANQRSIATTNSVLVTQMLSATTEEALLEGIGAYLQYLNLRWFALVLYEEYGPLPSPRARVVLSRGLSATTDQALFPSARLLPDELRAQALSANAGVSPVFVQDQHYGYLVYDQAVFLPFAEETVAQTVSRAIMQMEQSRALRAYAERLEAEVQFRTRQLQEEVNERQRAENALRVANAELRRTVQLDGLTGIYNRAAFDEYLQLVWEDHRHRSLPVSLILCDVDDFKRFNDHYGHLRGDQCLRDIARVLERSVRNGRGDMAARYGGEEFVLVLSETNHAGAMRVIERVFTEVAALGVAHAASRVSDVVTLSSGVITAVPDAASNPIELLAEADRLLYQAKQAGRHRYVSRDLQRTLA